MMAESPGRPGGPDDDEALEHVRLQEEDEADAPGAVAASPRAEAEAGAAQLHAEAADAARGPMPLIREGEPVVEAYAGDLGEYPGMPAGFALPRTSYWQHHFAYCDRLLLVERGVAQIRLPSSAPEYCGFPGAARQCCRSDAAERNAFEGQLQPAMLPAGLRDVYSEAEYADLRSRAEAILHDTHCPLFPGLIPFNFLGLCVAVGLLIHRDNAFEALMQSENVRLREQGLQWRQERKVSRGQIWQLVWLPVFRQAWEGNHPNRRRISAEPLDVGEFTCTCNNRTPEDMLALMHAARRRQRNDDAEDVPGAAPPARPWAYGGGGPPHAAMPAPDGVAGDGPQAHAVPLLAAQYDAPIYSPAAPVVPPRAAGPISLSASRPQLQTPFAHWCSQVMLSEDQAAALRRELPPGEPTVVLLSCLDDEHLIAAGLSKLQINGWKKLAAKYES